MKRNIIAGSVGGVAFIVLITALFLFYRRHQHKKISFFKRLQPKPRTRLLDGEDIDDYDMGPSTRYRDYPASVTTSHALSVNGMNTPPPGPSPMARSFHTSSPSLSGIPMDPQRTPTPNRAGLPPGASAPHLLGMRSETGSIFREAVWPPPGESSMLVDPITNASSTVDLSTIVDDVMGPSRAAGAGAGAAVAAAHGLPPPGPGALRPRGGDAGSTSSLVGEDPFASLSMLSASRPGTATHSRETSETPLLPRTAQAPPTVSVSASAAAPGPAYFDQEPRRHSNRFSTVPGSPMPPPGIGPLFITNMGPMSPMSPVSPSTLSPGSPPSTFAAQQALGQLTSPVQTNAQGQQPQPRNWLERSPKKMSREVRPSLDEGGVDVTDATSSGHGIGEAM